jgi:hypothetical protein
MFLQASQISSQNTSTSMNHEFKVRGFHIDLRTQVMTLPALKAFAKELSEFGINTIVMEWEATFPYSVLTGNDFAPSFS